MPRLNFGGEVVKCGGSVRWSGLDWLAGRSLGCRASRIVHINFGPDSSTRTSFDGLVPIVHCSMLAIPRLTSMTCEVIVSTLGDGIM